MSAVKNIVLVTGGNGGIGYEVVRQLISNPSKHVLLGSRTASKGEAAVKELASQTQPGTLEFLQLDVDNEDSINAAAKTVEAKHGRLDGLVNNAAISSGNGTLGQQMAQCYKTNVIGPQLMVDAFAPMLKKSNGTPRVVNVSSGVGSIEGRLNPKSPSYKLNEIQYRATKSALNMVNANHSVMLADLGIKFFAYCPGFTVSNLSDMNSAENGAKPTSEGAAPIIALLEGARDAENGGFVYGDDGKYGW